MAAHIEVDSQGRKYCILADMPEPLKTFASNFFPCSSIDPKTGKDLANDGMVVWFEIVDNWGGNIYNINQMVKNYNEEVRNK